MKKIQKLLLFVALLSAASFSQAQVLASFEDASDDFFDALEWGDAGSGGGELSNNPLAAGLNLSEKSLKNLRNTGCSWTESLVLYNADGSVAAVDAEHRYLHILVYSSESAGGRIHIRSVASDGTWTNENKDYSFDFTAGVWKDIVLDLQDKGFESINGLFLMSQDWSGAPADRHFYYDEIVLNADPTPRAIVINTASTIADFEDNGVIPYYTNSGNAFTSLDISENPYPTTLNNTGKVLYGETSISGAEWWGSAHFSLGDKVLNVNDDTRYLHILINTEVPTLEFAVEGKWNGSQDVSSLNTWFDLVIDLYNVGDNNFQGSNINIFDIIVDATQAERQGKEFMLDEIIVNNSSTPRTAGPTSVVFPDEDLQPVTVDFYTLQGIKIAEPQLEGMYIVRKVYKSGKVQSEKILIKRK